jgi:catechol 2,3-dioxygenase-like lactoylglutathione lyase family enzyme
MDNLQARTVFFVKNAEHSLRYYTETLGFSVDWVHREEDRPFVCQVSLLGLQLILNQIEDWTEGWAGHGRVFIGIDPGKAGELLQHIRVKGIKTSTLHWGAPTLVIRDLDGNEFFFWLSESERTSLETDSPPERAS